VDFFPTVLVLVDCCGLVVKWQCTLVGAISTCAELVFQIHVQLATFLSNTKYWHGLPLTKYSALNISFDISEKHVPWDPSGSLQQRLRDKLCFMGGGMSRTLNIAFNWAGQWTGEELDWAYVGQWTEEELDWVCIGPRRHQMRSTSLQGQQQQQLWGTCRRTNWRRALLEASLWTRFTFPSDYFIVVSSTF
jgi:hypothetical protein